MRMNFLQYLLVLGLLLLPSFGIAQTSDDSELGSIIREMRQLQSDMLLLKRQVYQGEAIDALGNANAGASQSSNEPDGALSGSIAGRMQIRIQQLETSLRQYNGRLEEVSFQIQALADQLTNFNRDVQFRLDQLEQGGVNPSAALSSNETLTPAPAIEGGIEGASQPAENSLGTLVTNEGGEVVATTQNLGQTPAQDSAQSIQQTITPSSNLSENELQKTPQELYQEALETLNQDRDYQTAEQLFLDFLVQWPQDTLAGNALYWLGETYYAQSFYERAVNSFIETYTKHPNSPKAPAALLKLAKSLDQIARRQTACEALTTLNQEYPNAESYILENARALQQDYACL